jgi:hypothetical protein
MASTYPGNPRDLLSFKSDNEDKRPDYRDQGIMGAKGGKTRRELDEEAGKFDDDAK